MNEQEGKNEIAYQMTMRIARHLYEIGQITQEEYYEFDTKMVQKYHPIIGVLFSDNGLI